MAGFRLLVAAMLTAVADLAGSAEMRITSIDGGGGITWTTSISNATYGLERSFSLSGPWVRMPFLSSNNVDAFYELTVETNAWLGTNLLQYQGIHQKFFRLVQLDWPPLTNSFRYTGYDTQGVAMVTGRLEVVFGANSNIVGGTWDLQATGLSIVEPVAQTGHGELFGTLSPDSRRPFLSMEFHPHWIGGNVLLRGFLTAAIQNNTRVYQTYSGTWQDYFEFWPPEQSGTFTAERIP